MAASRKSPTAKSPYIDLKKETKDARERAGFPNAYGPGAEKIIITGRNMDRSTRSDLLDGNVVEKVMPEKNSEFEAAFPAPPDFGVHRIEIRDARSGRIIDGTMFAVGHSDKKRRRGSGEKERDKEEEEQQ